MIYAEKARQIAWQQGIHFADMDMEEMILEAAKNGFTEITFDTEEFEEYERNLGWSVFQQLESILKLSGYSIDHNTEAELNSYRWRVSW